MNKNSLIVAICLAFICCTLGCETTDYEPLRVKRKLKELEQSVQELRDENESLRRAIQQLGSGGDAPSSFESSPNMPPMVPQVGISPSVPVLSPSPFSASAPASASAPVKLTAAAEQAICTKLESKNVFFSTAI